MNVGVDPAIRARRNRKIGAIVLTAAAVAMWGYSLSKLAGVASSPSPPRWIDYSDASGKREKRMFCAKAVLVVGDGAWHMCEPLEGSLKQDAAPPKLCWIDFARRDAVCKWATDIDPIRLLAVAPHPNGDLAMCDTDRCVRVHKDGGVSELPAVADWIYLRGLAWVGDQLQVVMAAPRAPATIAAAVEDRWSEIGTVSPALDTDEKTAQPVVAYRAGGAWELLYVRTASEPRRGKELPIEMFAVSQTGQARPLGETTLTLQSHLDSPRAFLSNLPFDGSIGGLMQFMIPFEQLLVRTGDEWSVAYRGDAVRAMEYARAQAYAIDGAALHWLPQTGHGAHLPGKSLSLEPAGNGMRMVDESGGRGPRFGGPSWGSLLVLPATDGGYWVTEDDGVVHLDASYRRTDPLGLFARLRRLDDNFDRLAPWSDFYLDGGAGKRASIPIVLLGLPIAFALAIVAWLIVRRRVQHSFDICAISAAALYLLLVAIYWGRFGAMLSRL